MSRGYSQQEIDEITEDLELDPDLWGDDEDGLDEDDFALLKDDED